MFSSTKSKVKNAQNKNVKYLENNISIIFQGFLKKFTFSFSNFKFDDKKGELTENRFLFTLLMISLFADENQILF